MSTLIQKISTLLIATVVLLTAPIDVAAGSFDVLFSSGNGVFKYNADDSGQACTTTAAVQPSTVLVGNNNEERAWNFMFDQGFSEQQVAGMIGNWQVEAPGVEPTTNQEGGGPGRGIAQWTVDERWAELLKWKGDKNEYDLLTQLEFVMFELNGTEGSALTALKATSTIKDATTVFMEKYERPGTPHLDRRITAANTAFGRYSSTVTEKLPPAAPSEGFSTQANNCDAVGSGDGASIVQVAISELNKNVREVPVGCDAGNPSVKGDCGPEVNKYTDNTLEYWCADFVSWVYQKAGSPFTGGASGGWRIAGVDNVEDWFRENATFTKNGASANPRPGDIYTLVEGGEDAYHIGIVEKVEGNTLTVISGNTSVDNTGNGTGVGRATYTNFRSDKGIYGFGSLGR